VQFTFDNHALDIERRELLRRGAAIAVQPQVFDLLVYLMQNRERVVSKDDLIALVWQGRIVSDSTLTSRINAARIAIGDSGKDQKLIRTIPRKGFRFVGSVTEQLHDIQPADAPPKESQPRSALPLPDRPAAYAQFVGKNYHDAIGLSREAIRQRSDFAGAYRVLTVAAGTAGQIEVAAAALKELRRAQPNISLAWIANQLPWKLDSDREHYLGAFRRAGLDKLQVSAGTRRAAARRASAVIDRGAAAALVFSQPRPDRSRSHHGRCRCPSVPGR
jgi:DNA-binding winged helix-turn-helix (wHTH) protein